MAGKRAAKWTERAARFVEEYLVDLNAAQAAIRAGYSARSARQVGHDLLKRDDVAEAIAEAKKKRSERVEVDQDAILRTVLAAIHTDRNGLTQYRRVCCRYCFGEGHRYQRTAGEMERDREAWAEKVAAHKADPKRRPNPGRFDKQGGTGYHKLRDPHPECPECFGEGIGEAFVNDTRHLTPEQRAIFEGVEQTRDGLRIKTFDLGRATELAMRHAGMLQDRVDHTSKGAKLPTPDAPAIINVTIGGK